MSRRRLPNGVKEMKGTLRKHRVKGDAPKLEACPVPTPPKDLRPEERRAWVELARQVDALNVYTSSCYTAFRMMVKCVAMLEDTTGMNATMVRGLFQTASKLLSRFGLDPVSADVVTARSAGQGERVSPDDEFGLRLVHSE